MADLISTDKQYVANTYNRFELQIVSGKGSRALDINGKEYIEKRNIFGTYGAGKNKEKSV